MGETEEEKIIVIPLEDDATGRSVYFIIQKEHFKIKKDSLKRTKTILKVGKKRIKRQRFGKNENYTYLFIHLSKYLFISTYLSICQNYPKTKILIKPRIIFIHSFVYISFYFYLSSYYIFYLLIHIYPSNYLTIYIYPSLYPYV